MKDEILSIANDAIRAIDEFENYLFANHRAKYAMSKSILDLHREQITQIKKGLELDLDDAGFNEAKSDLNMIIDDVNNARNGKNELQEPKIDTTEIDQMLSTLNEERVETEYPTGDINVNNINNSINTLESVAVPETPPTPEITLDPSIQAMPEMTVPQFDVSSDIDVNALDAFMNAQTQ